MNFLEGWGAAQGPSGFGSDLRHLRIQERFKEYNKLWCEAQQTPPPATT